MVADQKRAVGLLQGHEELIHLLPINVVSTGNPTDETRGLEVSPIYRIPASTSAGPLFPLLYEMIYARDAYK